MAFNLSSSVGVEGFIAGANLLSRSAEEFGNDPSVEAMWAVKAVDHAEVYFNILCSVDPQLLRLTPDDDLIYSTFRQVFPDLNISLIKEAELKNDQAKETWRQFCEGFKSFVEDYSFGTLLRLDCLGDYSENNTTLAPRIQFLAIEVARNREGFNSNLRKLYKPAPAPEEK